MNKELKKKLGKEINETGIPDRSNRRKNCIKSIMIKLYVQYLILKIHIKV